MTTPPDPMSMPSMDSLGDGWAPIPQAARRLGVSVKTLRRRVKASEVEARMVHDVALGVDRWMVRAEEPAPKAEVVSIEVLARLEEAWQKVSELNARAEVAERVAEFERERRQEEEARRKAAEAEIERLRSELDKPSKPLEADDRIQARSPGRWWKRKP